MARKQRNGGGVIEYPTADGDTVYRVQYRDASGRQVKETLGRASEGWTRTMARDERKKRVGEAADGYVRPEGVSFSDYADRWWASRQKFHPNYAEGTKKAYRKEVSVLKDRFGTMKLRDLTTVAVNSWTDERLDNGVSPSTVNRTLTVLGMMLSAAVDEKLLDANKKPNPRRVGAGDFTPRILTPLEARQVEAELAKHSDPQVRLAFLTAELLGLRRSELCGLRWQNIDFQEKRVRIVKSKTKKGVRSLYLPSVLLAEFEAHRQRTPYNHDDDFVFVRLSGSQWRPDEKQGYYDAFHRACKKIGITEHVRPFHDLRASFVTEALKGGVSAPVVMHMAGHESFSTTKRYADLAGVVFEDEGESLAERRMGTLRVIEGGQAKKGATVQEAHN